MEKKRKLPLPMNERIMGAVEEYSRVNGGYEGLRNAIGLCRKISVWYRKDFREVEGKFIKLFDYYNKRPVVALGLSTRAENALVQNEIYYCKQLVGLKEKYLLKMPRIGKSITQEIREEIRKIGLD